MGAFLLTEDFLNQFLKYRNEIQDQQMRRMLNAQETAEILGRSRGWLYAHLNELEKQGFPPKHPVIKLWDSEKIYNWLNKNSSINDDDDIDEIFGIA